MMLTNSQMLIIIAGLWFSYGLIWYSIRDHKRQVKKAIHRNRMRGKLKVIEGGKLHEHPETKDPTGSK